MLFAQLTVGIGNRLVRRMATPAGFEPATIRLEGERSIQLSYGVVFKSDQEKWNPVFRFDRANTHSHANL